MTNARRFEMADALLHAVQETLALVNEFPEMMTLAQGVIEDLRAGLRDLKGISVK